MLGSITRLGPRHGEEEIDVRHPVRRRRLVAPVQDERAVLRRRTRNGGRMAEDGRVRGASNHTDSEAIAWLEL